MLPEDLPFKVVRTNGHDEILVRAGNPHIGRAAYETAVQLFRGTRSSIGTVRRLLRGVIGRRARTLRQRRASLTA
jgi:hypothetical protein